jgi:NAD(P)H dehydrogenase (quinone)
MAALVVFAHPLRGSLCGRLADVAAEGLAAAGHEVELLDLYDRNFDPRLTPAERTAYYADRPEASEVPGHADALTRAKAIVFVFPTWWFGPPAMLKGWIDRVFAPGVAFAHAEDFGPIVPKLGNLRHAAVVTTLGSPWWVDRFVLRRPVRRIFKTAVIGGCAPKARFSYLPFYSAERPEPRRVAAFEERVRTALSRFR